jgi:hypothetical protein
MQEFRIAIAHNFKRLLESREQAREPTARSPLAVTFALEQQADGDRGQRSRKAVRRQHSEHHGEPERGKQIFRRAMEE